MARKKKSPKKKCTCPGKMKKITLPKKADRLRVPGKKVRLPTGPKTRQRSLGENKSKRRYRRTNPALLVQPPMGLAFGMQPPQNLFVGSAQYPIAL
jgi:hypothetical protein